MAFWAQNGPQTATWIQLREPLGLDQPVYGNTAAGPLVAISWPLHSWTAYVTSTGALADATDGKPPLVFIVQDDRFPMPGAS